MRRLFISIVLVALAVPLGHAEAAKLDLKAVNDAQFPTRAVKGIDPALVRAQILLDRARFSPGVIDGRGGENLDKAIAAFERANELMPDGKLDPQTWDRLAATSPAPALMPYRLTRDDVKGPFTRRIPAKMEAMARLKRLGYRNALERLAERFHMDERLLRALNPGKRFDRADTDIIVANVARPAIPEKAASVEVDKAERSLRVFGQDGGLIAVYPASIGSDEKPAPSGAFAVNRVVHNPTYTYNPDFAFRGVKAKEAFTIAKGPNNPVGSVWVDLTAETYGIHGTPEPRNIGRAYSNGCVRLTNWDVEDLAGMVEKGTAVIFRDAPQDLTAR
ncbi:L,D-transpeptidase [Chelatococcus sp. GCM10030263]|uniref:L,D-transpeptidase family protein n=1 Tax=Chelatococcus sp. GCM10030263 TaxID=3273387 RepID=UPI00361161FA